MHKSTRAEIHAHTHTAGGNGLLLDSARLVTFSLFPLFPLFPAEIVLTKEGEGGGGVAWLGEGVMCAALLSLDKGEWEGGGS